MGTGDDYSDGAAGTHAPSASPTPDTSTNGVARHAQVVAAKVLEQRSGKHADFPRISPDADGTLRRLAEAGLGVVCLLAALGLALAGGSAFMVGAVLAGLLGAYLLHRTWLDRRTEALRRLAGVDDLTGFGNQRVLWQALADHIEAARPGPLSLVMVDIDSFKEVNDRYGHQVGDAVLKATAMSVNQEVPWEGMCFRYGGDELLVIAPGTIEEAACELADAIRGAVANQRLGLPAVTVSCGVAEAESTWGPWELMDGADRALRVAKRTGRNRVVRARQLPGDLASTEQQEEVDVARRTALEVAAATLLARDSGTAHHADDVVKLAGSIASRLGIKGAQHHELLAAAKLHDIGKVGIGPEILNKPGPLTAEEWTIMREHTPIGERILRAVPHMAEVATIVRHSHEHYDGSGYPDGLSGEAIPLASRIILCADAFHAVRSDRPYRRGRSAPDAMREIRANAGTQFDPKVVDALEKDAQELRGRLQSKGGDPRRVASPRLLALLVTLTLGGGTALAASEPLRNWASSLLGGGGDRASHETADRGCRDPIIGICAGAIMDRSAAGVLAAGSSAAGRAPGRSGPPRQSARGRASTGARGGATRSQAPTGQASAGGSGDVGGEVADPSPVDASDASAQAQFFLDMGAIAADARSQPSGQANPRRRVRRGPQGSPRRGGSDGPRRRPRGGDEHGRRGQPRRKPGNAHGRGPSKQRPDRPPGQDKDRDRPNGGRPAQGGAPNQAGGKPGAPGVGDHGKHGSHGTGNSQGEDRASARASQSSASDPPATTTPRAASEDPAAAGASSPSPGADDTTAADDVGIASSIALLTDPIAPLLDSLAADGEADTNPVASSATDATSSVEALFGIEALPDESVQSLDEVGPGDGDLEGALDGAADQVEEPPAPIIEDPAALPPEQSADEPAVEGEVVP